MRARRADLGEGRSWAAIVSDPERARVTRQRQGPPVGWWAVAPSRAELSGESVCEVRRRVDLQQPVVLRDALPAGRRSRLELAATGADGQVGDEAVSYTHLRAHETPEHLVCRLLLEKKKKT